VRREALKKNFPVSTRKWGGFMFRTDMLAGHLAVSPLQKKVCECPIPVSDSLAHWGIVQRKLCEHGRNRGELPPQKLNIGDELIPRGRVDQAQLLKPAESGDSEV
jgi:hypothetical protein